MLPQSPAVKLLFFSGLAGYFICRLCDFRAVSGDALAIHNGTKHAQFIDLMPEDVAKAYREFAHLKTGGKKRFPEEVHNGVEREAVAKNGDERFACPTCLVEFEHQYLLANHMTNVNCRPPPTRCQCYKTFCP